MTDKKNTFKIISLGGSIIVPDVIDHIFLNNFISWLKNRVEKGERFLIICGGGATARLYQNSAQKINTDIKKEDLDWIGIRGTSLNAELIRSGLGDLADTKILEKKIKIRYDSDKPIILASGWHPGWSTDNIAVELAKIYKTKQIINLTNIDQVYDRDPREYPDAKTLSNLTWTEFLKLIPTEWSPGLKTPFDPVAAAGAADQNLELVVINGHKLYELDRYLDDLPFTGTKIEN